MEIQYCYFIGIFRYHQMLVKIFLSSYHMNLQRLAYDDDDDGQMVRLCAEFLAFQFEYAVVGIVADDGCYSSLYLVGSWTIFQRKNR